MNNKNGMSTPTQVDQALTKFIMSILPEEAKFLSKTISKSWYAALIKDDEPFPEKFLVAGSP